MRSDARRADEPAHPRTFWLIGYILEKDGLDMPFRPLDRDRVARSQSQESEAPKRRDRKSEAARGVVLTVDENAALGATATDPVLDTAVEGCDLRGNILRKDDGCH